MRIYSGQEVAHNWDHNSWVTLEDAQKEIEEAKQTYFKLGIAHAELEAEAKIEAANKKLASLNNCLQAWVTNQGAPSSYVEKEEYYQRHYQVLQTIQKEVQETITLLIPRNREQSDYCTCKKPEANKFGMDNCCAKCGKVIKLEENASP